MSQNIYIFDIDGTLLLTNGSGKLAFNQIFETQYGVKDAWRNIRPHGRTDDSLIRESFCNAIGREPNRDEIETIKQLYFTALEKTLVELGGVNLMPHVPDILNSLAKGNGILGIATGNYKISAHLKLRQGQLEHHFKFGGYGCDNEDRAVLTQKAIERGLALSPKNPENIFVIGDTVHDMTAGQAAKQRDKRVKTVAVMTTGTTFEEFRNAGADFILKDLSEWGEKLDCRTPVGRSQ